MATVARIQNNTLRSVYDDRFHFILAALGSVKIERASEVEFDHAASEWVATSVATGQVIARGSNRSEVIASEVRWLEENQI